MAYYDVCPNCGGNLDPGEKCDCQEEGEKEQHKWERLLVKKEGTNQLMINWGTEREMV